MYKKFYFFSVFIFLFFLTAQEIAAQTYDVTYTSRRDDTSNAAYNSSVLFAVPATASANNSGGGYFTRNSVINFNARVGFTGNSATTFGGAAGINNSTAMQSATLNFNADATFTDNRAGSYGGGIYIGANTLGSAGEAAHSAVNFYGNLTASSNTAGQHGGFLYSYSGTVNFNGTSVFNNNHADGNGGVIFARGGAANIGGSPHTTFNGDATLANNTAGGLGGAIYLLSPANGTSNIVDFRGTGTTIFQNNSDSSGANDIYMEINSVVNTSGSGNYLFYGGIASPSNRANVNVNHSGSGLFLADMSKYYSNFAQTAGTSIIMGDSSANFTFAAGTISEFQGSLLTNGAITNAGTLTLSGINKTVTGTLTGTAGNSASGSLIITGTITNNTTIRQNSLSVNAAASLTSNLSRLIIGNQLITNNGVLTLTDANVTNSHVINTSGALNISGNISNASVINNTGIIDASGGYLVNSTTSSVLSTNASSFLITDNLFSNAGTLIFTGGTNNNSVTGAGNTQITGGTLNSPTINYAAIDQQSLLIADTGSFQTDIDLLTLAAGEITNKGNLILTDNGTDVKYDITNRNDSGKGNLYISGTLTNTLGKIITQKVFTVYAAGNFSTDAEKLLLENAVVNEGILTFTSGTNNNAVSNAGTLTFTGGMTNNAAVSGTGNSVITGGEVINSSGKAITQNKIVIDFSGGLISNAQDLAVSSAIINSGTLTLTGGINNNKITDSANPKTGSLIIDGTVTNTAGKTISQNTITVYNGAVFTANADDLTAAGITNNGDLIFNDAAALNAKNTNTISGSGNLIITGKVLNEALISQNSLKIKQPGDFTASLNDISFSSNIILNDGNLRLTGSAQTLSLGIENTSADLGHLYIEGNGTIITGNDSFIRQNLMTINSGAAFTSNASDLSIQSGIANTGTLNLDGGTNSNSVTNAGNLTLSDVINSGNIVNQNGYFMLYGSGTNSASINNSGILRLGDVTNNGTITGAGGITEIIGAVINNVSISNAVKQNSLTIKSGGSLITNAEAIDITDVIASSGSLTFTAGNNSHTIDNDGMLYFNQSSAHNNANIYGNGSLIINGSITNNASINLKKLQINTNAILQSEGSNLYAGDGGVDISGTLHIWYGNVQTSGDVTINSGGLLNFYNPSPDTSSDWVNGHAKNLTAASGSAIYMDIFANGNTDKILIEDSAQLDGALHVRFGVGTYDDTFELLVASNSMSGALVDDIINNNQDSYTLAKLEARGLWDVLYSAYKFDVNNNILSLTIRGISKSDLSLLDNKTFNQTQVAKTFDYLSATAGGDMADIINGLLSLSLTDNQKRAALSEISPYFIANILRPRMDISLRTGLYSRIQQPDLGLWAEGIAGTETLDGDKNSIGEFKYSKAGARVGADKYMFIPNLMLGAYASYIPKHMEQNGSSADAASFGGGLYAGMQVEEKIEIKAFIDAAIDNYDTERKIVTDSAVHRTAKASFNGYTVKADVEAAYKINLMDKSKLSLAPFAGFESIMLNYESFTEKGAKSLNMDVQGNTEMSYSARLGIGVNGNIEKFGWGVRAEYDYIIDGYESEIETAFTGTKENFRSRGAETEKNIFGASIGINYSITYLLTVYVNGEIKASQNYTGMNGTAGIRYFLK